ncbi:deoxyribodipyrimidine photo-lyase [Ramlibacter sp. AW1]|uniref:Deoxyribodipyrimidine photo-lyase n=1 Tax=Ramlibacter aurantiacus TaxID=2801330 RepID=A0A936ZIS3_9BURK|nr:deoxyribodipyrimidine photo-lyase [Ramlibacter aurantiacus]MBL0422169.1 deoxyribodipyrimidine photo-lyase [Ramlibacter aurantiacus]
MPPSGPPDKPHAAGLMWFRRDLRAHDNVALAQALRHCARVHAVFVFDRPILDPLPRQDRRVSFIRESLVQLDEALRTLAGSAQAGLIVRHAAAADEVPRLARELRVQAVFANHDDEPAALARDAGVRAALTAAGIALHTFKDHTIFERREVLTQAGTPFSVFTPYQRAWLAKADDVDFEPHAVEPHAHALADRPATYGRPVPLLSEIGFEPAALPIPAGIEGASKLLENFAERIDRYHELRDFPALRGPSYLGVHLRFGTLSIRQAAGAARQRAARGSAGAATWLKELIWREFYFQILANFAHVADASGGSHSFRREYDAIEWERGPGADALFAAWCEGRTGYPLVDAAMRQLASTGYMHNRLRMVAASFLCKDLGLDWRSGERWFARLLNDFELASNNGGWQWASSSGCDAQPWFRIFNPVTQSRRFDTDGRFIRRYVPELAGLEGAALHAPWTASSAQLAQAGVRLGLDYPRPVVDHAAARERTLRRYAVVKAAAQ